MIESNSNVVEEQTTVAVPVDVVVGETGDMVVGRVLSIAADCIVIPDDPNRDLSAYSDESFQRLKESIDATKGNTVHVKVRMSVRADGTIVITLTSGHRRVRACLETGHPVRAVVTECEDERKAYLESLAENELREDLSPYERGRKIEYGFQEKYFRFESEASRMIGVDKSDVNKLRRLGRLNPRIVAAFPSSSDLQFRHAQPLTDAVTSNPQAVLAEADRIAGLEQKPKAREVVALLVAAGSMGPVGRSHTRPADLPLSCDGQAVGQIKVAKDGTVAVELAMPLERKEREQLAKAVEAFVRRRVLKE